ncbi:sigma-70 family RNA polymerase sigma factor [Catelliglobosispora koreensis]|uniref:sigma-70 family RNA polymerase sigma factor n=1 Tax=Catelliglobosispora koreensis TaxID=129052 RepID=UPI0003814099|nr:sigma-70 family RNA polymerase sigma factor [Catelliglobosispora koreensis]
MGTNVTSAGNQAAEHPVSTGVTPSFESFYEGTSTRLLRFAYGLTGDLGEAQDFTQEAYVRAWQRWKRLQSYDNPESWLRLVVTRLATDRWRWLGVRRNPATQERAHVVPPPNEDLVHLVAELKRLPMDQRKALVLHYFLDRSVADIAAETGANINTVKSWLARGRANLAVQLTETPPLPPAKTIASKGKQRRTIRQALAFFATAATATAAYAFFVPAPAVPPADPDLIVRFDAPAAFGMATARGDRAYVMWLDRDSHEWIAAIDLTTRTPAWKPLDLGVFGDTNGMEVARDAIVMLTEQGRDYQGDTLIAVSPETGKVMWHRPYSFNETHRLLFDDTLVLGLQQPLRAEALDLKTGAPRWTVADPVTSLMPVRTTAEYQSINGWSGPPPPASRQVAMFLTDGRVQVRDAGTGAIVHQLAAGKFSGTTLIADGMLYGVSKTGVTVHPLDDSAPTRTIPVALGELTIDPVMCTTTLLCVSTKDMLTVLNVKTGQVAFEVATPNARAVSATEAGILVTGFEGAQLFSFDGKPLLTDVLASRAAMWLDARTLIAYEAPTVTMMPREGDPNQPPDAGPAGRMVAIALPSGKVTTLPIQTQIPYCSWARNVMVCPAANGIVAQEF